jgi:LysM repeat protein
VKKSMRYAMRIIPLLTVFVLFSAGSAYTQDQEYKDHTVSKGETLWGISSRELVDPFLWPKVWKENPGIKNPDLIYPGQRIRIPLFLLQKEVAPSAERKEVPRPEVPAEQKKEEEPVVQKIVPEKKTYLFDRKALLASGYILDEIDKKGEIIGAPSERTVFGKGDYVYIRTVSPTNPGDRFYVVRLRGPVHHPETNAFMGNIVTCSGVIEVVGREDQYTKAVITDMFGFQELAIGDFIDTYYDIEPPLDIENPRVVPINGYVVASRQGAFISGQFQVVYVDRGKRDSIEVGDLLPMISVGQYLTPNGFLRVINVREKTATGIITRTQKEVYVGDRIGPL